MYQQRCPISNEEQTLATKQYLIPLCPYHNGWNLLSGKYNSSFTVSIMIPKSLQTLTGGVEVLCACFLVWRDNNYCEVIEVNMLSTPSQATHHTSASTNALNSLLGPNLRQNVSMPSTYICPFMKLRYETVVLGVV